MNPFPRGRFLGGCACRAGLVVAMTIVLSAAAQASCRRWDVASAPLKLLQGNNIGVDLQIQSFGGNIKGTAVQHYTVSVPDGGQLPITPRQAQMHHSENGRQTGNLEGVSDANGLEFRITWGPKSIGVYKLVIDASGRLTGETYDFYKPTSRARILGEGRVTCLESTAAIPLAPLDVVATLSPDGTRARVSWGTPDQGNQRRVTRFLIERQSPPGPGRPRLREGIVAGPDGEQTATTKLAFSFTTTTPLDPALKHGFIVCSMNSSGQTCAGPVLAVAGSINMRGTDAPALPVTQTDAQRRLKAQQGTTPIPAMPRPASAASSPQWKVPAPPAPVRPTPGGDALKGPSVKLPAPVPGALPHSSLQRQSATLP